VLDGLDAVLDPSCALRCREMVRALSARTQFVVVTHNRATIERAKVLYGVTTGADGVSRGLSLH
jgi:chromosome segregation protein